MKGFKFKKTLAIIIAIVLVIGISAGTAILVDKKNVPAMTTVENGLSAYELAVQYGYEGTVQEWLDSLNGKSAYEIAKENGYTGTETEWTTSLKATAGKDGVGIKTAAFSDKNELLITLTDGTVLNLGVANGLNGEDGKDGANGKDGADGKDGANGKDGVGITSANINAEGQLVLSFSDGKTVNLQKIVGMNGTDGIGISSSVINAAGELVITYTNGQTANLGVVIGTQGEQGLQGEKGETGATGATGNDGVSIVGTEINNKGELVITLSDNTVSNLGVVVGAKGDKGETGATGATGATGDKGDKGDQGEQGIQGDKGDKGDKGETGAAGNDGVSVTKTEINQRGELVITLSDNTVSNLGVVVGAKGDKGDQGEQGIQGIQGEKGETGAKGDKGDDGVGIETIVIENGNLKITLTNETTLDLGNIKGEKGDKGDTGATGATGEKGDKGDKGDKGEQGIQGIQGATGATGNGIASATINEYGELVIEYTNGDDINLGSVIGPKGDKGDQGEQGLQGIQGATGATGNGIASATINEYGELVIVYTNGDDINLGKVIGDKGDKGETGATGATGAQGEQGIQGDKGDKGDKGETGRGIVRTEIVDNNLVIYYTDDTTETHDLKGVVGSAQIDLLIYTKLDDGTYVLKNIVEGCEELATEINIPSQYNGGDVISIGNRALSGATNARKITIPNTVRKIGEYAFYNCSSLTNITIPNSVTRIAWYAFQNCSSLTSITIPNGITLIEKATFMDCTSLTSITIPSSVTKIEDSAFKNCTAIKDVWYYGTESDKANINIGSGNGYLQAATWHYIEKGEEPDQPESVPENTPGTEQSVGISEVTLVNDELIVTLSNGNEYNLGNVKGDKGDKGEQGEQGIQGVSITEVTLTAEGELSMKFSNGQVVPLGNIKGQDGTDGVGIANTEINADGNLVITYTNGVTKDLGSVKGPKGDKGDTGSQGPKGDKGDKGETGRGILRTEFSGTNFVIYYTDGTSETHDLSDMFGDEILKFTALDDGTYSVKAGAEIALHSSVEIPATYKGRSVTVIEDNAFNDIDTLETITIPDSVTTIGASAFENCTNLSIVNIPDTVEAIDEAAFKDCVSLTVFDYPDACVTMPANCFYGCKNLSIVIPETVTTIEEAAMLNVSGITVEGTNKWHSDRVKRSEYDADGRYVTSTSWTSDTIALSKSTYITDYVTLKWSDGNISTTKNYVSAIWTRVSQ